MKLYRVTYFDHLDWRHVTYLVVADSPATVEQNVLDRELRGRPYRGEEDSLSVDELEGTSPPSKTTLTWARP